MSDESVIPPQERPIQTATMTPETEPFWAAAAEGRLVIQRCIPCDKVFYYPRSHCPFCLSDNVEWEETTGEGTIYSYSVARRVPVPYAIAYVELAEGPIVLSNIVDADLNALSIGQPVRLTFKTSVEGVAVPMFTPAEG